MFWLLYYYHQVLLFTFHFHLCFSCKLLCLICQRELLCPEPSQTSYQPPPHSPGCTSSGFPLDLIPNLLLPPPVVPWLISSCLLSSPLLFKRVLLPFGINALSFVVTNNSSFLSLGKYNSVYHAISERDSQSRLCLCLSQHRWVIFWCSFHLQVGNFIPILQVRI